jgi:hypothetical protein
VAPNHGGLLGRPRFLNNGSARWNICGKRTVYVDETNFIHDRTSETKPLKGPCYVRFANSQPPGQSISEIARIEAGPEFL